MDYQATLYNPIYAAIGVPCTMTIAGVAYEVRVLDKTAGVAVGTNTEVQTVEPAAVVRAPELSDKGIPSVAALKGAILEFNGRRWRVRNWQPKPSPRGEDDGEVYLFLSGAA